MAVCLQHSHIPLLLHPSLHVSIVTLTLSGELPSAFASVCIVLFFWFSNRLCWDESNESKNNIVGTFRWAFLHRFSFRPCCFSTQFTRHLGQLGIFLKYLVGFFSLYVLSLLSVFPSWNGPDTPNWHLRELTGFFLRVGSFILTTMFSFTSGGNAFLCECFRSGGKLILLPLGMPGDGLFFLFSFLLQFT